MGLRGQGREVICSWDLQCRPDRLCLNRYLVRLSSKRMAANGQQTPRSAFNERLFGRRGVQAVVTGNARPVQDEIVTVLDSGCMPVPAEPACAQRRLGSRYPTG